MPTLSAMFRLMDGYSSQIDKMMNKTNTATEKMLKAVSYTHLTLPTIA